MATELARYKKQLRHQEAVEATTKSIDERLDRIEAHLGIGADQAADADGTTAPAEASTGKPKGRK